MIAASTFLQIVTDHIEQFVVGKSQVTKLMVIALMGGGHVLIEDVPGVGKTSLVSALAAFFHCSFQRIQFTPDVMPSDVVGFSMYNPKTQMMEFKPGAVFCNFLLADEINRTTPKTQSSLLEVMQEAQVTVDAFSHKLPAPFLVFATQNPIEHAGTFPLPEAQLDRFFIKIKLGYPTYEQERKMLTLKNSAPISSYEEFSQITSPDYILALQQQTEQVHLAQKVSDYLVTLIRKTRYHDQIVLGASPRVTLALQKAAKAAALLSDRDFVTPDDIQQVFFAVVGHRIHLTQQAKFSDVTPQEILAQILGEVAVPVL